MPYVKQRYVNGLRTLNNWYDTLQSAYSMQWQNRLETSQDLDWQNRLKTINDFNWQNNLKTINDLSFTGVKYEYVKSKKEREEENKKSTLADYNDPKQINSIRDIILGSFNPNMEHSKLFGEGVAKTPILNIIPDTIQYIKDYIITPIADDEAYSKIFGINVNHAVINTLYNLGETMDIYMNPLKATIITAWNGGDASDIAKAIQSSLVGDENGIKNFDYDTGNMAADLFLEVFTDPLTYFTFGGKGAVNAAAKGGIKGLADPSILVKATRESLEKAGVKSVANMSDDVLLEFFEKSAKSYGKALYNKGTFIKEMLQKNISDELIEAGTKSFMLDLSGRLGKELGTNKVIIQQALDAGMRNTISDVSKAVYKGMSGKVLTSIGLNAMQIDDIVTKSLLQIGLAPSGMTPLYHLMLKKNSPVKSMLSNMKLNKAVTATQDTDVIKTIAKEQRIDRLFSDATDNLTHETALAISYSLGDRVENIKSILKSDISSVQKEQAILKLLKEIDSEVPLNSIDDFADYLEQWDKKLRTALGDELEFTGMEAYVDAFKDYANAIKYGKKAEQLTLELETYRAPIQKAETLKQVLQTLESKEISLDTLIKNLRQAHFVNVIDNEVLLDGFFDLGTKVVSNFNKGILNTTDLESLLKVLNTYATQLTPIKNIESVKVLLDNIKEVRITINKILQPTQQAITVPGSTFGKLEEAMTSLSGLIETVRYVRKQPINTKYQEVLSDGLYELFFNNKYSDDLVQANDYLNTDLYQSILDIRKDLKQNITTLTDGSSKYQRYYDEFNKTINIANEKSKWIKSYEKEIKNILNDTFKGLDIQTSEKVVDVLKKYSMEYTKPEMYMTYQKDLAMKHFGSDTFIQTLSDVYTIQRHLIDTGMIPDFKSEFFDELITDLTTHKKNLQFLEKALETDNQELIQKFYTVAFNSQENSIKSLNKIYSDIDAKNPLTLEAQGFGHDLDQLGGLGSWKGDRVNSEVAFKEIKSLKVNIDGKEYTLQGPFKFERQYVSDKAQGNAVYYQTRGLMSKEQRDRLAKEFKAQVGRDMTAADYTRIINTDLLQQPDDFIKSVTEQGDKYINIHQRLHELEEALSAINIEYVGKAYLDQNINNKIHFIQIEHSAQNSLIEDSPTLRKLRFDGNRKIKADALKNESNSYIAELNKFMNDDEKMAISLFEVLIQGKENKEWLRTQVQYLIDNPKYNLPKELLYAVLTTMDNYSKVPLDNLGVSSEDLIQNILHSAGLNINTSDLNYKKVDIDTLLRETNVTEVDIDNEIRLARDLNNNRINYTGSRHDALYDTFAQHLAYERKTNQKYYGYTLDIETTGLVDKNGVPNGDILEVSIIKRNNDDTFTVVFDKKIQSDKDTIRYIYNTNEDALESMGITQEEYFNKYVTDGIEYTPDDLMTDLLDTLRVIPDQSNIMSHNGNLHDWIYLRRYASNNPNNMALTFYDKKRFIEGKMTRQEYLHRLRTFDENVDRFNILDSRELLTKNKLDIKGGTYYRLQTILEDYLSRQRVLKNYEQFTHIPTTVVTTFDNKYFGALLSLRNADYYKELPADVDSLIDYAKYATPEKLQDMLIDVGNNARKTVDLEALKNTLSKETKEQIISLIDDIKAIWNDIGKLNKELREFPIPHELFDHNSKNFNQKLLDKLKIDLAEIFEQTDATKATKILESDPTNLSQILSIVSDGMPFYAYKSVPPAMFNVLDFPTTLRTSENITLGVDFYKDIVNTYNRLSNTTLIKEVSKDFENIIIDIKNKPIIKQGVFLKYNEANPKTTLAQIEVYLNKLRARTTNPDAITKIEAVKQLQVLQTKYPKLFEYLDSGVFKSSVSVNNNYTKYIPSDLLKERQRYEYFKQKAIQGTQEDVIAKYKKARETVPVAQDISKLNDDTIASYLEVGKKLESTFKDGYATNLTRKYKRTARQMSDVLEAHEVRAYSQLSAEAIRNDLIENTTNMTKQIFRPDSKYFNNKQVFASLIRRKKELKDVGVLLKYDESSDKIILSIDDALHNKLKLNRNKYAHSSKYSLNGEDIITETLPEIAKEDFMKYLSGPEDWKELLWNLRQNMVKMNPELSGKLGLPNYEDYYKIVETENKLPEVNWSKALNIENPSDKLQLLFGDSLGTIKGTMEVAGVFNPDYFEMSGNLLNKMWNHTTKYHEYANWVMQGGLKLNSPDIAKMSLNEIREMLEKHKDYVVAFLVENPKSTGGLELVKLNSYADKVLKKAIEKGAVILPYDFFSSAMRNINEFTYGNNALAIWNKLLTFMKKTWLFDVGVIFRNFVDSTMRTFAEGGSVTDTAMNYVNAFTLLRKYDKVTEEIRRLSPLGRFTLENMDTYFKTVDSVLDRETYSMLQQFLEDSGINTLNILVDGIFGKGMKANNYIERTSRLAMFLGLRDVGTEYSEIIRRISQVHFNYDTKSYGDFLMQSVIPFWTYTASNINYMIHLIEENPAFIRNYFNVYTPIWDFDSLNHDELEENLSLQYQIINGNIPLKLFGYKDKEITRMIDTKYGPQEQKVTNTATIRVGSSIIDGLTSLATPVRAIINKTAPPIQTMLDTVLDYMQYGGTGNISDNILSNYQESEDFYKSRFGSSSLFEIAKDPTKLLNSIPGIDKFIQRFTYTDSEGNRHWGTSTTQRTDNQFLGALSTLGITGATSRWGEFTKDLFDKKTYAYPKSSGYSKSSRYSKSRRVYAKKTYHKKFNAATPRPGQGVTYRTYPGGRFSTYYTGYSPRTYVSGKRPWSEYENFLFNVQHPNYSHNRPGGIHNTNMMSIPQYLYSYMGKNKYGKSKILSWMNMNTRYKVKSTLRRLAT